MGHRLPTPALESNEVIKDSQQSCQDEVTLDQPDFLMDFVDWGRAESNAYDRPLFHQTSNAVSHKAKLVS